MWEGEGRTLPLMLTTWKTEGLSLNEKGHCRRKIWIRSCKYFACLLFQGTHYIMHVKDFIRLKKNQRAPILTERPVVPQFLPTSTSCFARPAYPGASTISQGRCPWSTGGWEGNQRLCTAGHVRPSHGCRLSSSADARHSGP